MTTREAHLVMVDGTGNHNKYYTLREREDGSVEKSWGRVGARGESSVTFGDYDKTLRDKKRKGYVEVDVVAESSAPSANKLGDIARTNLAADPKDAVLIGLIDKLVATNRHAIVNSSGGMITVADDGVVRTPLGIISDASIVRARTVLADLANTTAGPQIADHVRLVEDYLKLVPQKVPYRAGWATNYLVDPASIARQETFLDQLQAAVSVRSAAADDVDPADYSDLFRFRVSALTDTADFTRLNALYEKTKNDMHAASRLKLKRAFVLADNTDATGRFESKAAAIGNTHEMWHGSQVHNVLSILKSGLFVPTSRGGFDHHGRMFGDGVYLSNQSSKSLNYSYGAWNNTRNSSCFMFLTKVAMGKEYRPDYRYNDSEAHSGRYHSVNIKAGTAGVRNHEAVVWDLDQLSLRYLLEFSA